MRGDCGFGNEPFIAKLEKRNQAYLFKLRQTGGVKKLLMRQFERKDWATPGPSDQGWSGVEDTLKLSGGMSRGGSLSCAGPLSLMWRSLEKPPKVRWSYCCPIGMWSYGSMRCW